MSTCRVCQIDKPLTEFNRRRDSYRTLCRPCQNAESRAYYASNRTIIRYQQLQKYWNNPEHRQQAIERAAQATQKKRNPSPEQKHALYQKRLAEGHTWACAAYKHYYCRDCVCICHASRKETAERRAKVSELLKYHLLQRDIAERLGVSVVTIKRDCAWLRNISVAEASSAAFHLPDKE